eukprot:CAMPEP_0176505912 /NCGR_PEP_ID=MMETSP0200_2-20121128/16757_1 /TAXON_ID=947934 /ORGANISM="Chaetoceros sp., Strain GSL56" /LENGTH=872 /DNA_ID=CAMNT_0017905517 /DNA_START=416 /DNA_END=3031 /DNA_ORIENTATION=-
MTTSTRSFVSCNDFNMNQGTSTTAINTTNGATSTNTASNSSIKPNKVKKNHSYFHSKPSTLVDLIVNKDWQRVMNRCTSTSHSKEIYITQKIRLYGVDRKLLPLHIACAMRPPKEVIASLLRPDTKTGMSTVKTVVKNCMKHNHKMIKHYNTNNNKNTMTMTMTMMNGRTTKKIRTTKKKKQGTSSILSKTTTRMKRNWGGHGKGAVGQRVDTTTSGGNNGGTSLPNNHNHHHNSISTNIPPITIQSTASSLTNSISNHTTTDFDVPIDLFKEVMEPATCKTAPLSPTTCTHEQDYDLDDSEEESDNDDSGGGLDGGGLDQDVSDGEEEDENEDEEESITLMDDDDDDHDGNDHHNDKDHHEDWFQDYYRFNYRNQVFFPEKEELGGHHPSTTRSYALQITPSGQVKHISPNGKSSRSTLEAESPFVYASLFHTSKSGTMRNRRQEEEEDLNHDNDNSDVGGGDVGGGGQASSEHQQNMQHASMIQSVLADDFLPIHIACLYRASPEVIALLIQCYPEGVEQKNNWGMLPLHIVCSNYSLEPPNIMASKMDNDSTTRAFLNNLYKESMESEESSWDMEKVVQMLVDKFPQSVNIPSDNIEWYTPLEYAARNITMGQGREEIIGILRKAQEQQYHHLSGRGGTGASASFGGGGGATATAGKNCDCQSLGSSLSDSRASNGNGIKAFYIADCPLLYTYISGKQWDRTMERLQTTPEEASYWVVDKDYPRLPIHLACSKAAPMDVVESLLNAYPEGCLAKDGSGSHPLHLACEKALGLDIVNLLLKQSRKAARIKDEIGRLPLHLACASGANSEVVKALVDAYPQSCYMKDYNGHTAFTYADYSIEDDAVKNEISSTFQVCEERLFGGQGRKSRN